jgi:hypothetical protein
MQNPFAACPLERAPQINELPCAAMSDLARRAQLKADQTASPLFRAARLVSIRVAVLLVIAAVTMGWRT